MLNHRDPHRYRWIIWGVLALVFLLVNLHRLSTAVLNEELMRAFSTSAVQLGSLHAVFFFVYAPAQLPAGVIIDRIGPRYTATIGTIVMSLGALVFAQSSTYFAATNGRILIGLGGSVIYLAILRVGTNWFHPEEFGTLNGMTVGMAGLGGIIATTPLAFLATTFGWRTTYLSFGFIGIVLAGIIWVFVRTTPESIGLPPVADDQSATTVSFNQVATNLLNVLRDPISWLLGFIMFCTTGVTITILGLWGIPYVSQIYNLPLTTASYYTLLGSIGLFLGPPIIGYLSDRTYRRLSIIFIGSILYTFFLGLLLVLGTPPLILIGIVFFGLGFLTGGFVLTYPIIKDRHPNTASGVATGIINMAAFLGAAFFPTVMGYALDTFWTGEIIAGTRVYTLQGYRIAFGIGTSAAIIAVLCTVAAHYKRSSTQQN